VVQPGHLAEPGAERLIEHETSRLVALSTDCTGVFDVVVYAVRTSPIGASSITR